MNKLNIKGEDLKNIGFPQGKAIGAAIVVIEKKFRNATREEVLEQFAKLALAPLEYMEDEILGSVATALVQKIEKDEYDGAVIPLKDKHDGYTVYGADHIEEGAIKQMEIAMTLPVTVAGALMPDAHQGYGLPIGGVLATNNAIIPFGVGVDIGCRMALSIFDIPENHFMENQAKYKRELLAFTKFGAGNGWHGRDKANHEVLDRSEFNMTPFVKNLHDKASVQLGSSGGGNHFVEWGIIEMLADDEKLNIKKVSMSLC